MEKSIIFEMADRLKSLKKQKKDLEDSVKALGSEIEELDRQLSDAMTEAELDRFFPMLWQKPNLTVFQETAVHSTCTADCTPHRQQAAKMQ